MKLKFKVLLVVAIMFVVSNIVLAVNYTYKVYNPNTNKTHIAVLGTMSITDKQYIWGFFTKEGQPLCVANLNTNIDKNGLIGGQCTDINAFVKFMQGENIDINSSKYIMGFRELNPNTFYKEMNSVQMERAAQGKSVYTINKNEDEKEKSSFSPRYKAGQSDTEICIRNHGGTQACMEDSGYSKIVADVMKNGGCIASVPDMGQMYKDLKYCQTTKNTVNILYLPTGETKVIKPLEYNEFASMPPMSDYEYNKELMEYKKSK